jgi:hypothetical protein
MKNGTKIFCTGAALGFLLMLLVTVVVIVPDVMRKYDADLAQRDVLIEELRTITDRVNRDFQKCAAQKPVLQ